MSYSAAKHAVFSNRVKASMVALHDSINREMEVLDDIYTDVTVSGTHADFTDTDNATKQEHVDAIVAMRAFQATLAVQLANVTLWLQ